MGGLSFPSPFTWNLRVGAEVQQAAKSTTGTPPLAIRRLPLCDAWVQRVEEVFKHDRPSNFVGRR